MLLLKLIAYSLLGFLFAGGMHELGHCISSILLGWKFNYLVIGPFRFEKSEKNNRVIVRLEKNIQYWGGISSTLPSNIKHDNFRTWSITLIAGPLTSIVFGLILLPVFMVTHSIFLLLVLAESLGIGLFTLLPIPIRTGILFNDGYRFFRIQKRNLETEEEYSLFRFSMKIILEPDATFEEIKDSLQPLLVSKDLIYQYYAHYCLLQVAQKTMNKDYEKKEIESLKILSPNVSNSLRKTLSF